MKKILFIVGGILFILVVAGFFVRSLLPPDTETTIEVIIEKKIAGYPLKVYRYNYHATVPFIYRFFFIDEDGDEIKFLETQKSEPNEIVFSKIKDNVIQIDCIRGRIDYFTNYLYINKDFLKFELNTQCKADS